MSHVSRYPAGTTFASESFDVGPTAPWAKRLNPLETLNRGFDADDDFSEDLDEIADIARAVRDEELM